MRGSEKEQETALEIFLEGFEESKVLGSFHAMRLLLLWGWAHGSVI